MCNNKELCTPELAAFLTTPPRSAPMSATTNFHSSSSSLSSRATAVTSYSNNNYVQDYAA